MSTNPAQTRRRSAALIGVTAAAALAAAPAPAAAPAQPVVCVTSFTATIAPGFTQAPSAGKLTSGGQTGALECFGELGGARITGPGSMGFTERHRRGSCRGHAGTGRVHLVIPTTAGDKDLVGRLSVRRRGLGVSVTVRFPGLRFRGSGVVFPKLGNCASTPLEQIRVTITGALRPTQPVSR